MCQSLHHEFYTPSLSNSDSIYKPHSLIIKEMKQLVNTIQWALDM